MNLVSDSPADERHSEYQTVADDYAHESMTIVVYFGTSDKYLEEVLERAAQFRG